MNSEDGKIKEEIHSISSLINRSLKLEVTFCVTRAVNFHSVSLLLSLAMLVISSTHGTGLRPQILAETCEGLVQTCIRHPPKYTALSLAGVRTGPACITPLASPRESFS